MYKGQTFILDRQVFSLFSSQGCEVYERYRGFIFSSFLLSDTYTYSLSLPLSLSLFFLSLPLCVLGKALGNGKRNLKSPHYYVCVRLQWRWRKEYSRLLSKHYTLSKLFLLCSGSSNPMFLICINFFPYLGFISKTFWLNQNWMNQTIHPFDTICI